MKKHTSKEAFVQRLQELAEVKKNPIKESRTLGTLIDYKRAADGVAYGIVKESHHYYVKKSGIKENPDVSDFAYIGGLENITEYQYKKLSEADKHRNMILNTINEAISLRPDKNGSKKKMLTEDKAAQEIEMAASKVGDLDAATDVAAAEVAPEGGEEMPIAEPAPEGGEELPAELPAPEGGEELPSPEGGEEMPIDEPAPEGGEELPLDEPAPEGDEEMSTDEPEGGEEAPIDGEDEKSLTVKEIEKGLGKVTGKIRKTELEPSQVKSYVNSFLAAFKDKFDDVEIEDRKEMADKILKVVPDEDVEAIDVSGEEEMAEDACVECGGFGKYAESRGYTQDSVMECGEEEMANLVSGYANAHNDGMNDGDFKLVALLVTPETIGKLKDEYGHDDYTEKLTPYMNQMGESTEEDKLAQINEFWGGLKQAFGKVGGDVKAQAQKGYEKVKGAAEKASQAVGQYATDVKQAYHTGEVGNEIKRLEKVAQDLGKQVAALNTRLQKAGQQPVNVQSILQTVTNQLSRGGAASLGKYGVAAEGVSDPANVEVQPNMLKEDGEEEISFAPAAQTLGAGVVKPDGAPTTEKEIEIKDSTVNISLAEQKIRKYVRARLEEKAGKRKSTLNENKKSDTLKKLDALIDEQYETALKKKLTENVEEGIGDTVVNWMGKASQWAEGKLKKQKDLRAVIDTLTTEDPYKLNHWIFKTFPMDYKGGIEKFVHRTPAEQKLIILQNAANDQKGLGELKIGANNWVEYVPSEPTKEGPPSGFAQGRSRLGA